MDFIHKIKKEPDHDPELALLEQKYPHILTFYDIPPEDEVKLDEFREMALERLKLLRVFEMAGHKSLRFMSDEWKEYINAELAREGLKNYLRLLGGASGVSVGNKRTFEYQARRRDYISHYILRLSYCRTEELKQWFIAREMEFFRYKFLSLTTSEVMRFLELNQLKYHKLTETEKEQVKDGLYDSTISQSVVKIELLDFYKVHFSDVGDLVRAHRCYLKKGYAYITTSDFVSVLSTEYKRVLYDGLEASLQILASVDADERIYQLLTSLHSTYTGKDYTLNKGASVPIESLDDLSKKSYPLCMKVCHDHLRATHHMKHGGRMQYGLFIKGIGVTLEDAVRFWREEFTKNMDAEKFAKSYEYNIHHNYGKKGGMVNYSPYSCMKIIQSNPTQDDPHGCPFKWHDPSTLRKTFTANGLGAAHIQDILSFVSKGHYQLACAKYFQVTHNLQEEIVVTHPNQYFEESQRVMDERAGKKTHRTTARKPIKRPALLASEAEEFNKEDYDALWEVADAEERAYVSKKAEESAWNEQLDLTEIDDMDVL